MASFDKSYFLGARASFPGNDEKLLEVLAFDELEEMVEFILGDDDFACFAFRLFHLGDRRAVDELLFLGPVERPLNRAANPVPGRTRPPRMPGEKLRQVVGRQLADAKIGANETDKRLDVAVIPIVGLGSRVLLSRFKKCFEDGDSVLVVNAAQPATHQLVILIERLLLVGAEIDLLTVDLDVPELARRTEERFRKLRHVRTLQRTAGPEGSRPESAWWQPSGGTSLTIL